MTAVLPDLETIDHLDFDHTPDCASAGHKGAARPARWRLISDPPCGHGKIVLLCDPCAATSRAAMERLVGEVECKICLRLYVDGRRYIHLEPLS